MAMDSLFFHNGDTGHSTSITSRPSDAWPTQIVCMKYSSYAIMHVEYQYRTLYHNLYHKGRVHSSTQNTAQ